MLKYYFLLLLATVCAGKFELKIRARNYSNRTIISHEGSDLKLVTDKEIKIFNLTDDNLKRGLRIELGKTPEEVFLRDPTAYGDVFQKYEWPEVRRKMSIKNTKTIASFNEGVTLKIINHINNSSSINKSKIDMVASVTNTVCTIWGAEGITEEDIKYNVTIDFGYGNIVHKTHWRDNKTGAYDMAIRKKKGVIEIQSGQSIVAKLLAEKVILLVLIEMDGHLMGNVVANYEHTYGKYHLWAPTIGNIMRDAELRNEIRTKLVLEVIYFTNPRIEMVDKDTGEKIFVKH